MTSRIKTRRLSDKDIPQIINIERDITKKKVPKSWPHTMESHIKKENIIGFVAVDKTDVIGYIIGEIKGLGFGMEKSGWIEEVGVHPKYMGAGIGKTLAKKMFEYFKKTGLRDIYIAVNWDAIDMLSFLKSVGFDRSVFMILRKHLE